MVSTNNIPGILNLPDAKYLLAVSGGIDSMVMASMFAEAGIEAGIAHCNFTLRGEESNGDENFVCDFALRNNMPFHLVRFDTTEYASKNGISIQQAARKLRYEWFEHLRREHGYYKIAVAHNADDNLETFFINLLRGAGLGGLTGIVAETETIVRPLTALSRRQIEEYAREHKIAFREDSSNASDKYLRNKLRHIILPALDDLTPAFREKAAESLKYLKQANDFVSISIETIARDIVHTQNEDRYISIEKLKRYASSLEFIVFNLLAPYGFKREIIRDILEALDGESGRQFIADKYVLVKDRDFLILSPRIDDIAEYLIEKSALPTTIGGFYCEIIPKATDFKPDTSPNVGQLDADKLHFPLLLRAWNTGDRFVPFGMKGRKKLSDFFIDNKIPVTDKRKHLALVSGKDIVWLAGCRIDERYKITNTTREIFIITSIEY